jgi:hypothetical protein
MMTKNRLKYAGKLVAGEKSEIAKAAKKMGVKENKISGLKRTTWDEATADDLKWLELESDLEELAGKGPKGYKAWKKLVKQRAIRRMSNSRKRRE